MGHKGKSPFYNRILERHTILSFPNCTENTMQYFKDKH